MRLIKSILVLGVSGMLGSMVFDYLSKCEEFKVLGTVRNPMYKTNKIELFNANQISQLEQNQFRNFKPEYIINCIGITKPFIRDNDPESILRAIKINTEFPWNLDEHAKKYKIKVIQIGTDCVFSGKKGKYIESDFHDPLDIYGKTKSLGEVFDGNTLIIRSSIIGPELKSVSNYLLEWFLSQSKESSIDGFEHHIWNGVTTLQFAQLCEKIIETNNFDKLTAVSNVHHFIPNNTVNKYQLLKIFNEIFEKNLKIRRVNKPNEKINRSLSSLYNNIEDIFEKNDIKNSILALKRYMKNKFSKK